jgi:hypothetical protein
MTLSSATKTTLIDVEHMESCATRRLHQQVNTIDTYMGASLDYPVHHESEWCLKFGERCIYQHTNREWSQCPHHSFSRLCFSTTPMPFHHPGQCSHRIQVTQRTRYLEVTAKVDIVTIQYTVTTPLHSYTSSMWLSFVSLPRHTQ